jgi:hypothetical protein
MAAPFLIAPPYARQLRPDPDSGILVFTGSEAWEAAQDPAYYPRVLMGRKLLLPYGAEIGRYRWPVQDRPCFVASYGRPEPEARLHALCIALVQAGAPQVYGLWKSPVPLYVPKKLKAAA